MALINCPECKKEISEESLFCINCGLPRQKSIFTQDIGFDGVDFRLMAAFGLVLILVGFLSQGMIIIFGFCLFVAGLLLLTIRTSR